VCVSSNVVAHRGDGACYLSVCPSFDGVGAWERAGVGVGWRGSRTSRISHFGFGSQTADSGENNLLWRVVGCSRELARGELGRVAGAVLVTTKTARMSKKHGFSYNTRLSLSVSSPYPYVNRARELPCCHILSLQHLLPRCGWVFGLQHVAHSL